MTVDDLTMLLAALRIPDLDTTPAEIEAIMAERGLMQAQACMWRWRQDQPI